MAQDFGGNTSKRASFQALPGSSFTVQGATADQTSLLVSVGLDVGYDNGFSLGGSVASDLSLNTSAYSGTARLNYRW